MFDLEANNEVSDKIRNQKSTINNDSTINNLEIFN